MTLPLEECRADVIEWLNLKMKTGRYSDLLVDQLAWHMHHRTLNTFAVYDEIDVLEGSERARSTTTKAATEFTGPVLKGLWHKHFSTAAMIPKNLLNHWTFKRIRDQIDPILNDGALSEDERSARAIHRLVIGGHEARSTARGMTGEWIIFAKYNEANYYLTLAAHGEDDCAILARAVGAANELGMALSE